MKKRALIVLLTTLSLSAVVTTITVKAASGDGDVFATDNVYWNHYAEVAPTLTKHGSKEFWANCSTLNYSLEEPEPGSVIYEGVAFDSTSYFDELDSSDPRYIAPLTANIKEYFHALIESRTFDPYGYIPETMRPTNSDNFVNPSDVNYDFTSFNSVSSIKYGGFGEQWHMVIENIKESENFYKVFSVGDTVINASVLIFDAYLDDNTEETAHDEVDESTFRASIDFSSGLLTYSIEFKTSMSIPFFGDITPRIDMVYSVATGEKAARIQLTENNAMKYIVTENAYRFGVEYGIESVSRKAYFQADRDDDGNVTGHIYEFVQYKDKDLVPSCADFYIGETYTSVVGNKASGIVGFAGFINELYKTDEGKLLGYEIREEFTKWGISATYHTLWFNLNNISGINNVKAIANGKTGYGLGADNNHDIYLNSSSSIFTPTYNKKLVVNTSRKYDVEMRKQYFYSVSENVVNEHEVELPMMFIQADHDSYTNFSDFPQDILSKSGINASVNLAQDYLDKIQSDYATLIDVFKEHKGDVTGDIIADFIG